MKMTCEERGKTTTITSEQDGPDVDIFADDALIASILPDGTLKLYDLRNDGLDFQIDYEGCIEVVR